MQGKAPLSCTARSPIRRPLWQIKSEHPAISIDKGIGRLTDGSHWSDFSAFCPFQAALLFSSDVAKSAIPSESAQPLAERSTQGEEPTAGSYTNTYVLKQTTATAWSRKTSRRGLTLHVKMGKMESWSRRFYLSH